MNQDVEVERETMKVEYTEHSLYNNVIYHPMLFCYPEKTKAILFLIFLQLAYIFNNFTGCWCVISSTIKSAAK